MIILIYKVYHGNCWPAYCDGGSVDHGLINHLHNYYLNRDMVWIYQLPVLKHCQVLLILEKLLHLHPLYNFIVMDFFLDWLPRGKFDGFRLFLLHGAYVSLIMCGMVLILLNRLPYIIFLILLIIINPSLYLKNIGDLDTIAFLRDNHCYFWINMALFPFLDWDSQMGYGGGSVIHA